MKMQPFSRWASQEQGVLTAWRGQMAEAAQSPRLRHQLMQREQELWPCFAAHYTQLRALPRRVRRSLQRRWRQSLAGVALLMALGQGSALAATLNVDAGCTLVDAITAANTDTATGGCAAGSKRRHPHPAHEQHPNAHSGKHQLLRAHWSAADYE